MDECEDPDACSQICVNYKGYFKCECHPGYEMDSVTKNCKAVGMDTSGVGVGGKLVGGHRKRVLPYT